MSKTICPLPWTFLAIRNNGDYRLCCQANTSSTRGLLKDDLNTQMNASHSNIDDVRNAHLVRETRMKMLAGEWAESCSRCQKEEENGLQSRRQYETEAWGIDLKKMTEGTQADGSIDLQTFPLKFFDIRFGNKCNLACRMCGPTDSDFWYSDYVKLSGNSFFEDTHGRVELDQVKSNLWKAKGNDYNWYEIDFFWDELQKNSEGLVYIYLAGGEPLLIEEHYNFLNKCIEMGRAQNICLEYNTNITVLPQKALKLWKSFKRVRLGLSIDGIGDTLEYQRYPLKWNSIERNICRINEIAVDNINAWLACTVTAYNIFHLPDFIKWKLSSDLKNINKSKKKPIITHHMAHNPKHLNVRVLPNEVKSYIEDDFLKSLTFIRSEYGEELYLAAEKIYKGISSYMKSDSYHETHWSKFTNYTKGLDQIRSQNFANIVPAAMAAEMGF